MKVTDIVWQKGFKDPSRVISPRLNPEVARSIIKELTGANPSLSGDLIKLPGTDQVKIEIHDGDAFRAAFPDAQIEKNHFANKMFTYGMSSSARPGQERQR